MLQKKKKQKFLFITTEMDKKLCKIWNTTARKALFASNLEELILKGTEKLQMDNEKVRTFLEDGTEIDENEVFKSLPEATVIYLLTDKEKVK